MKKPFLSILFGLFLLGCTEDSIPKPQGYLRLEYPIAKYEKFENDYPFTFGKNVYANIKSKKEFDMNIEYPEMKATIFLSYKTIDNNLNTLLKDAQRITYQHTKKAETILEQPFVNPDQKVYGMFYQVGGNAASATQFYLTDSIKNFVTGSVYFNTKPNADSLLPASEYLKNDVRLLIESFQWRSY